MSWPPLVNAVAILTVHAVALFGAFSGASDSNASVVASSAQSSKPAAVSETAPVAANPYEIETDRALGNPDAAVTVIEYASVTCGVCADFHKSTYKQLKEEYIDTNKIRFILREIPTPPRDRAFAGFLLARCVPEDKYFGVIDVLFRRQANWAFAPDAYPELEAIATTAGLSVDAFQTCLKNQAEIDRIEGVADFAYKEYGITGTPSFVINGKKYPNMSFSDFQKVLDELLAVN